MQVTFNPNPNVISCDDLVVLYAKQEEMHRNARWRGGTPWVVPRFAKSEVTDVLRQFFLVAERSGGSEESAG